MRIRIVSAVLLICIQIHLAYAISADSLGAKVELPAFSAQLGIGFNYDFLKEPTDVSFEYPKAFFGFNVPLQRSVNLRDYIGYASPAIDSVFADSTIISNGSEFKPTATARQNPNVTVRVEVPMMGGVASFSNIQNFHLKYQNVLGNPNFFVNPQNLGEDINFLLRGTINVPLNLSLYWETMTFGYAYKLNRYFSFALNLHRHVFALDLRGKVDVDIMGRYNVSMGEGTGDFDVPSIDGDINYPSSKIYGAAYGHYETEVWTPTLGAKAWRFALTSRFGIDTRVKGEFYAKYTVPFFLDPETFEPKYDFESTSTFNDPEVRQGLLTNATDSMSFSTKRIVNGKVENSDLIWKMPTALTLSFEVLPEHIKLSYTKLFGNVQMKLDRIARDQKSVEPNSTRDSVSDSVVIDFGVNVDHIILLQCNLWNSFINLGVFGFDIEASGQKHLIGKNMPYLKMGESAMLPVLNLGTTIGKKLQLLLELDVLPLPALKTGIYYNF